MLQENAVYIVALIIVGIVNALFGIHAYRQHTKPGATAFAFLMLTTVIYAWGYAFEIAHSNLQGMLFSLRLEYLGIAPLPAFWIITAVSYVGSGRYLTRSMFAGLFFIPIITLILHFTNNYHHLFYSFG